MTGRRQRTALETERLTLRPFTLEDAGAFQALAGDLEVARMTSDIPHPIGPEEARRWLEPAEGERRFAVCRAGHLIGGAGTFRRDSGVGELGFWLGRAWWGQGLATEAARAVIVHALAAARYTGFSSSHFDDNPASARVLAKLGFEPAGSGRIWSEARHSTVATQWVWLPLERARALHASGPASATAVAAAAQPRGIWSFLRGPQP